MWREAYSYHLPLSGVNFDFKDYKLKLEDSLPKVFQTSELLSSITQQAWEKRVTLTRDNYHENQTQCDNLFFSFVDIKDDTGNFFRFDDDDYSRQGYLMKNSDKPMPISWFVSEKLCEDLECAWEQYEKVNDFDITEVAKYINRIISS